MTIDEAVELRKKLELDLLALLQEYREATGLTPTSVDVHAVDVMRLGAGTTRSMVLTGVRVTVEL